MFRLWVKVWKDNHLIHDTVVENDRHDTRTHKCRFTQDAFIEEIDFDYLEIWVIEEDAYY